MAACGIRTSPYDNLKALIQAESESCAVFNDLKYYFEPIVGSVRRMECIRTAGDLMNCLERLDALSEYNIDTLRELAECLENETIQNAVAAYVTPKEQTSAEPRNMYREYRLSSAFDAQQYGKKAPIKIEESGRSDVLGKQNNGGMGAVPPAIPAVVLTESQRNSIYKLLSRNIGSSWRFFGRELGVSEGDMDAVELQFSNDLASRIYKLLQLFEENECGGAEESQRLRSLCRALDACGRKDLRRKIMQMIAGA